MMWEITLSTSIALDRPALQSLPAIREAGFRRIQLSASPVHLDFGDETAVAAVRSEAERLGLSVTSIHAPFGTEADITVLDDTLRQKAVQRVLSSVSALSALGGRTLVIHAGSDDAAARNSPRDRLTRSVRSLVVIQEACRRFGVTLAIEEMLAHLLGGPETELQWILENLPPSAGAPALCLDTGHSFLSGRLMERTALFGPRAVMVHAHDNNGDYDSHLPPGDGKVPWTAFLDALAGTGFSGEFVLEIHPGPDLPVMLAQAARSIRFLEQCARDKPYSFRLA